MAKNDLILLDTILNDYYENERPTKNISEVFEFFSCEQIFNPEEIW